MPAVITNPPILIDPIDFSREAGNALLYFGPFEYNRVLWCIFGNNQNATSVYYNTIAVFKSINGGATWTVADQINSPSYYNYISVADWDGGSKVYFAYETFTASHPYIVAQSFDFSTGLFSAQNISSTFRTFGVPGDSWLYRKSDGTQVYLYSRNIGGYAGYSYKTLSSAGVWGAETDILSSGTNHKYIDTVYLDSTSGILYIFYRRHTTTGSSDTVVYYFSTISNTYLLGTEVTLYTPTAARGATISFGKAIVFNNNLYVPYSGSDTSGDLKVFIGTTYTSPTWTNTLVVSGANCLSSTADFYTAATRAGNSIFSFISVFDSKLYIFYVSLLKTTSSSTATVDAIYYTRTSNGTTWDAAVLYYDELTNPPPLSGAPNLQYVHTLSVTEYTSGSFGVISALEYTVCLGWYIGNPNAFGGGVSTLIIAVADANTNTGLNTGVWNTQDSSYVILANTSSTGGTVIGNGNCPPFPINIGDQAFEFYGLLKPEVVEVLPVGKKFDQVGPIRFDKLGKLLAIRTRIITTESAITLRIHSDSEVTLPNMQGLAGDYSISIPTIPYTDDVYEIKIPKTIKGTVFRIELGPNCGIFYRYDMQIKVQVSGMQSDPKWVKVDNQGIVPYGGR